MHGTDQNKELAAFSMDQGTPFADNVRKDAATKPQAIRRKDPSVLLGACRFQVGQAFGELVAPKRHRPVLHLDLASSAGRTARRGKVHVRETRVKKQSTKQFLAMVEGQVDQQGCRSDAGEAPS